VKRPVIDLHNVCHNLGLEGEELEWGGFLDGQQ
jgi:hypothetical protein